MKGIGIVFKGAGYVNDQDFVAILYHQIRAVATRGVGHGLVDSYLAPVGSSVEAGDDLVMSGTDRHHVGMAVAEDMGECFGLVGHMASATGGIVGGPSAFGGVCG